MQLGDRADVRTRSIPPGRHGDMSTYRLSTSTSPYYSSVSSWRSAIAQLGELPSMARLMDRSKIGYTISMIGFALLTIYMVFAAGQCIALTFTVFHDGAVVVTRLTGSLPCSHRYPVSRAEWYQCRNGLRKQDLPEHRPLAIGHVRAVHHLKFAGSSTMALG